MAYPIKAIILPYLLEKQEEKQEGATALELFNFSGYGGDLTQFKGGLSRLAQRGFLQINKSEKPYTYSLSDTERAREHAKDVRKGIKEGLEKKRAIFSGYAAAEGDEKPAKVTVKVKVKKVPEKVKTEPVKPPEPPEKHTPIRTPGTVERKILEIMVREGAITMQEVYAIAKEEDTDVMEGYAVVKSHILMMLNMKYAELDLSTDPLMYYLTDAGEEYIQNHYPQHALEV